MRSLTVSTHGFVTAAAAPLQEVEEEEVGVFFLPEEEEPDFLDLSGVLRERERVGRAADICNCGAG